MRAAAIAAAVFAAFVGVMYLRFSSDAVPEPPPKASPIVGADGSVCFIARRVDAREPTPAGAGPTRVPCSTVNPSDPIGAIGGSQPPKPTPTRQPVLPDMLKGMKIVPLDLGPPIDLPGDLALIIATGCTQCDGGPTGLVRVYARPDGSIANEPLLDPSALGLPMRHYTAPDGTISEYPPFISGYAIAADASKIVAGICLRGTCAPDGLSSWSPDSQTALFRSTNGGVSWTEMVRLDVGATVLDFLPSDETMLATYDTRESTAIRAYPGLYELSVPTASQYWGLEVLPDGQLIWRDANGIFVRSNGGPLISVAAAVDARPVEDVLIEPSQMDGLALLSGGETQAPYTQYLVPFDSSGAIGRGLFSRAGDSVSWSTNLTVRLSAELPNGLILGNAWVPTNEIAPNGQPLISIPVPVLVDLTNAIMRPLRPFTDPGSFRSRDTIAFQQGPFARVVNTDNTCLNIRAEPGAGQVLDCAAEGVLLRDLGQTADVAGVAWLRVATPAGLEGWASTRYLER